MAAGQYSAANGAERRLNHAYEFVGGIFLKHEMTDEPFRGRESHQDRAEKASDRNERRWDWGTGKGGAEDEAFESFRRAADSDFDGERSGKRFGDDPKIGSDRQGVFDEFYVFVALEDA